MTLYGIPNCDTVKKARAWLAEQGHVYEWHDYKKQGINAALLTEWSSKTSWETLLNRQGSTWRKLDDTTKASVVDAASAIAVMLAQPSVIKRPVLEHNGSVTVGYKPELYATLFNDA